MHNGVQNLGKFAKLDFVVLAYNNFLEKMSSVENIFNGFSVIWLRLKLNFQCLAVLKITTVKNSQEKGSDGCTALVMEKLEGRG